MVEHLLSEHKALSPNPNTKVLVGAGGINGNIPQHEIIKKKIYVY
jgi:hypothetical protein